MLRSAFQRRTLPITCIRQSNKNCNSWRQYSVTLYPNKNTSRIVLHIKDWTEGLSGNRSYRRELSKFPVEILAGHVLVARVHIHFVPQREHGLHTLWWQVGEFYVRKRLFVIVRIVLQNAQMYNVVSMESSTNTSNLSCTGIIHNRCTKSAATSLKLYLVLAFWAFTVLVLRVPCIVFKSALLVLEYIHNRCTKFPPHRRSFCAFVVYMFHCVNGWF